MARKSAMQTIQDWQKKNHVVGDYGLTIADAESIYDGSRGNPYNILVNAFYLGYIKGIRAVKAGRA